MSFKLTPEKVFNITHLNQVGDFIKATWPKEVIHILRIADDATQNTFLFDRPWDMEPTIHPVTFTDSIDWEFMPEEDDEWIFMLARHGYLANLGEAYSLSQDEKYPATFVRLVTDFIHNAKLTTKSIRTTWRTIDSAIRVENWLKAYIHMHKSPAFTEEFMTLFLNALIEHGNYLHKTHDSFRTISNWGVLQNQGLFLLGAFFSEEEFGQTYMQTALTRLKEHATIQIMDDGTHWEQSPMYHNEVLHAFQNVISCSRRMNTPLPLILLQKTRLMCHTNLNWAKPNHHQVMQGDSDNTDLRDMITRGALLFKDSVLKFGGFNQLDPTSCWYEGYDAIAQYDTLATKEPSHTSIALSDSGNYYLRNSWGEDANFLHFHCGSLGSGHGHANLLHIDLFAQGEDILMDSGRFTYIHKPIRTDFKSAQAHNTPIVDGLSFTECTESWDFGKIANYLQHPFIEKDNLSMVQGTHMGYMHLPNGSILTNRKVIYIKPDIYILVDSFIGKGTHTYELPFHFNTTGVVSNSAHTITYQSDKVKATLQCMTSNIETTLYDTLLSLKYNQLENNKSAKFTLQATGNASILTVIHTQSAHDETPFSCEKIPVTTMMSDKVFSDQVAEGLHLKKGEEEYTLLIGHQDFIGHVDLALVNGFKGYGQIRVFDKEGNLTVLVW